MHHDPEPGEIRRLLHEELPEVVYAEAAQRATDAGCSVVMDGCIMVDHAALLGRDRRAT